MSGRLFSHVRTMAALWVCMGSHLSALEVNDTGNAVFDLYYFGSGEVGIFGTVTGQEAWDAANRMSGTVKDSSACYWTDTWKQAMLNAVNTWTNAITTSYDTEKHARKLRIGFFLDDASTGGVMTLSMAGYAATQTVTTRFEPEYGTKANIYSVAEWAWRDNNETSYYAPPADMPEGAYWETDILPDGKNCIDIAIVLNPVVTSYGFDAQGNYYYNQVARSAEEMQNIATHEIGHGMGMDSWLYEQTGTGTALSGCVSTWDSLITLNGEHIVTVENGEIQTKYETLGQLQSAAWEVGEGLDATDPNSYTGEEIQYDPARRLSLSGEVGVHIAASMLEGDTLEHLSYDSGFNVLGPGGRENSVFSENDLRALELVGWGVRRDLIPEPTTGVLCMLCVSTFSVRRRRR